MVSSVSRHQHRVDCSRSGREFRRSDVEPQVETGDSDFRGSSGTSVQLVTLPPLPPSATLTGFTTGVAPPPERPGRGSCCIDYVSEQITVFGWSVVCEKKKNHSGITSVLDELTDQSVIDQLSKSLIQTFSLRPRIRGSEETVNRGGCRCSSVVVLRWCLRENRRLCVIVKE